MVSAESPSENMCALHPINEWTSASMMGGRYFHSNSSRERFQKVVECIQANV